MAANFFKTDGRSIIPKDWGDYGHILQHGMILPHSHPRRSMIGAYGDGGCFPHYEAQTGKPQLGVSHRAVARSAY